MKYKFKNAEVEKALRLVANELGINHESFDKQIDEWGFADTVYMDDGNRDVLFFPTKLIEKVKVFNPNGWNEADAEPPKDPNCKLNPLFMLVEDSEGLPHKAFFDFEENTWIDAKNMGEITCLRYRIYPTD